MQNRGLIHGIHLAGAGQEVHASHLHRTGKSTTDRTVTVTGLLTGAALAHQGSIRGVQLAEGALVIALETVIAGTGIVVGGLHEERDLGSIRVFQTSHKGDILTDSALGGAAILATVLSHRVLRVPVAGGVLNLRNLVLGQVVVGTRGGDVLGQHVQGVGAVHGTAQHHDFRTSLQVALAANVSAALAGGGAFSLHLFGRAGSVTGGGCCRDGGCLCISGCGGIGRLRLGALAGGGCLSLGDGRLGLLRRRRGRGGGRKRVLRVVSRTGGAGGRRGVFALRTAEAAGQSEEQGGGASGGAHRAATPTGGVCLSVVERHRYLSRE